MPATIIETGMYTIVNVHRLNHIALSDDGSWSLAAGSSEDGLAPPWNAIWKVTKFENGRYTIRAAALSNKYVCWTPDCTIGSAIVAGDTATDWVVKETRVVGEFAISPVRHQRYWGFDADDIGTPGKLRENPASHGNSWKFLPYQGEIPTPPESMNESLRNAEALITRGLEDLPSPVRRRILRNRTNNQLRYSEARNDVVIQVPRFLGPTLNVASDFSLPDEAYTDGGARELLAVLKLLPHQSNAHLARFEEVAVTDLVHDNNAFYCKMSSKGLVRLVSDHFHSISEEGNVMTVTTDIGTFVLTFSDARTYVRYHSRNRENCSIAPPNQDFALLKRYAMGQYLRRHPDNSDDHNSNYNLEWTQTISPRDAVEQIRLVVPECLCFMARQRFLGFQTYLQFSNDVMTAINVVAERSPQQFEHLETVLQCIIYARSRTVDTQESLDAAVFGYSRMIGVIMDGTDSDPDIGERVLSFVGRAIRCWRELFEGYAQDQSHGRVEVQDRIMATCNNDPRLVCALGAHAVLVKGNASVILDRAVEVPERWHQVIVRPNSEFYIAAHKLDLI